MSCRLTWFAVSLKIESISVFNGTNAFSIFVNDHSSFKSANATSIGSDDHSSFGSTRHANVSLVLSGSRWTDAIAIFIANLAFFCCASIRWRTFFFLIIIRQSSKKNFFPSWIMKIQSFGIRYLLLSHRTTALPRYPGRHSQIIVLTGFESRTLQAAFMPQGSIFSHGFIQSPSKHAVCDGQ